MVTYNLRYSFRQLFKVSARRAFAWCTDFAPDDLALEGVPGRRKVAWITPDTVVLTDRFPRTTGGSIQKVKLVRLDRKALRWTSTHLSGPAQYSQFWYRIVPEGRGSSWLEFNGFELKHARTPPGPPRIAEEARRLGREDSTAWRHFARAMERELGRSP